MRLYDNGDDICPVDKPLSGTIHLSLNELRCCPEELGSTIKEDWDPQHETGLGGPVDPNSEPQRDETGTQVLSNTEETDTGKEMTMNLWAGRLQQQPPIEDNVSRDRGM